MAAVEGVGPPYHVAARLIGVAVRDWHRFDGWCASRNVDPLTLPLDRLCNLVWYRLSEHRKPDEVERLEAELHRPHDGDDGDVGPWSADAELAAFGQASQAAGTATR